MAMNNNPNYGYFVTSSVPIPYSSTPPTGIRPPYSSAPPTGIRPPYSSTPPTGIRPPRPRFAYSAPAMYPRPRSSASKPNCTTNNPEVPLDTADNDNSYQSNISSNSPYFSCNESFYQSPNQSSTMHSESYGYPQAATPHQGTDNSSYGQDNSGFVSQPFNASAKQNNFSGNGMQQYNAGGKFPAYPQSQQSFPKKNASPYKAQRGGFQNSKNSKQRFGFLPKKHFKAKKTMAQKVCNTHTGQNMDNAKQGDLRCELCNLDFSSQIPLDMHLRGAKHNKKLKAKNAMEVIQLQGQSKEFGTVGNVFRCDLCNLTLNSSLQLQMHLDGTKHKNKLRKLEEPLPKDEESKDEEQSKTVPAAVSQNGKGTESLVRPLPEEFDDPRPTKLAKYSCELCNLIVNSPVQLQQHLGSKRHEAKVLGIPYEKKKKNKKQPTEDNATTDQVEEPVAELAEAIVTEPPALTEIEKKVLGVKSLESCFVPGEVI